MSTVATLWVKLGLDSKGYKSGLETAQKSTSKFAKVAKTVAAGAVAALGVATVNYAKDATLAAARADTLGIVTERMGQNIGLTTSQIRGFEEGIQSMGITTIASREAVAQLIRAQIDLSKSSDLARLAQNAAVIAGENSSDAFSALSVIIATGNTLMARRRGLMVNFVKAEKELAESIGKTREELTDAERSQARLNEIMSKGEAISGVYEATMETAGKKALSFARHAEELKIAVGATFQATFAAAVDSVTEYTKALKESIDEGSEFADSFAELTNAAILMGIAVDNGIISQTEFDNIAGQLAFGLKDTADVVKELTGKIEKFKKAIDDAENAKSFDKNLRKLATSIVIAAQETKSFDRQLLALIPDIEGVGDSLGDLSGDTTDYGDALKGLLDNFKSTFGKDFIEAGASIREMKEETTDLANEAIFLKREAIDLQGEIKKLESQNWLSKDAKKELESLQEELVGSQEGLVGIQEELRETKGGILDIQAAWRKQTANMIIGVLAQQAALLEGDAQLQAIERIRLLGEEWGITDTKIITANLEIQRILADTALSEQEVLDGLRAIKNGLDGLKDKSITVSLTEFRTTIKQTINRGTGDTSFNGVVSPNISKLPRIIKPAELSHGGIIPQGFDNDTFPALLSSGERVIPAGGDTSQGQSQDNIDSFDYDRLADLLAFAVAKEMG